MLRGAMYRDPARDERAPSLPYLRAALGSLDPSSGLAISPDIPPKKLQGVLTYAQPTQGEVPLLIVDSSVMLSGKAGMLLTDRAAYFDNPRARVPIEAIVYPPVAAQGAGKAATLPTAMGPIPLPDMLEDYAVAMLRALRAVAFFNRGASRFPYGQLPFAGPVGELAAQTLVAPELPAAPRIPARQIHVASNLAHAWLDHDAGEELLCLLDETASSDGTRFIALTDRRVIALVDAPVDIPYAAITGFTFKPGMLSHSLAFSAGPAAVRFETIAREPAARAVADFLTRLGSLAPEHRAAWPAPPPTADDPSGAAAAMQSLSWPDARVATILELVHATVARGTMTADVGRDLVTRALRLQRTLRGGHGRTGPMQRSPLGAADLELTLSTLFGAPVWAGHDGASRVVDFELGHTKGGANVGALASTMVGLTLLAVVGFGWISTGSGARTLRLRARIWEGPGGAGFTLQDAQGAPLARDAPKVAGGLLETLAEASAQTLLRRALSGWEVHPETLQREPVASVEQRARALVPYVDVAPFFAG